MTHRRYERLGSWAAIPLFAVVLTLSACAGTGSPTGSATESEPAAATSGSGASGAVACVDAETAAIIQSLRDDPANAQATLEERGDDLRAGLQRFTPPAEATTWREELVAAIEGRDAAAVQALVQSIGSEVVIEFC